MRNAYDKWLAGEGCCNSNYVHIETSDCKKEDVCECERILMEISNLHTDDLVLQEEIDELSGKVETISGEVDNKLDISAYTDPDLSDYYTKEEVDNLIPDVPSLAGYATEQWVLDKHYISGVDLSDYAKKSDLPTIPKNVSYFYNDSGYLTQHQPLKTINGQPISGTGNIEISSSGGSVNVDYDLDSGSTNPIANSAVTVAVNSKLDASAYTPVDLSNYALKSEIPTVPTNVSAFNNDSGYLTQHQSLAGYATEQWVLDKHYISGVDLSDYALKSEIPTVPTSNSAFTNDEHFITSGDTVFNNYALTANTYTKTEVDNKFWCGTQAQYDALQNKRNDVLYLIHE